MSDSDPLAAWVEALARGLVEHPEAVSVSVSADGAGRVITLEVDDRDVGQIIGRGGRVVRAIRTTLRAAAAARGERVTLDIVD